MSFNGTFLFVKASWIWDDIYMSTGVCIVNRAILCVSIRLTLEKDKHLPNVVELHMGKPFDYV
jgi:hypothetical protein